MTREQAFREGLPHEQFADGEDDNQSTGWELLALLFIVIVSLVVSVGPSKTVNKATVFVWATDPHAAIEALYSRKDYTRLKDALQSPERNIPGFHLFAITARERQKQ